MGNAMSLPGQITNGSILNWMLNAGCLPSAVPVAIPATGWVGHQKTVSVTGVTATNIVIVSPVHSSAQTYADCDIYCSGQGTGALTFTAAEDPTVTVNVVVIILPISEATT